MSSIDPRRRRVLLAAVAATALPNIAFGGERTDGATREPTAMKIRLFLAGETMTATLEDNPSAREFVAMLPLDLEPSDFGGNEKIATLPRKLRELTRGPVPDARVGDLCYFGPPGQSRAVPWRLSEHARSRAARPLRRRLAPLIIKGEFTLRIERID